ncbi:MAG TPA: hypothetical protein VGK46_03165 [Saprospiraceae bacterium]|jgi:hypothetical protein
MDPFLMTWCQIINQIHTLDVRTRSLADRDFYQRRFDRIRDLLKEANIHVHNPEGESYDFTRTDCEAMLQGDAHDALKIVEVIKPVIYHITSEGPRLIQPGVVIIQ